MVKNRGEIEKGRHDKGGEIYERMKGERERRESKRMRKEGRDDWKDQRQNEEAGEGKKKEAKDKNI